MPTVHYILPEQGWRPYTNPRPLSGLHGRLGGLGRLGDSNTFSGCVQAYDSQSNPVACGDPSAAVWVDANGNAVPAGTGTGTGAAAQPTAGAPTGSYLTYKGTWAVTLTQSADTIISKVRAALAESGLQVTNVNAQVGVAASAGLTSFAVSLQLLVTGSGFAQPSDAGSIVDHAYYSVTGKMPVSSSTVVQSLPSGAGAGAAPPPAGQDWSTWLQDNALWIGLGIVGVVVLPKLL